MKTIFLVSSLDQDTDDLDPDGFLGESEGMMDTEGNILHWWSGSDASWSPRDFNPLLAKLGYEVSTEYPEEFFDKFVREVLKEIR